LGRVAFPPELERSAVAQLTFFGFEYRPRAFRAGLKTRVALVRFLFSGLFDKFLIQNIKNIIQSRA
jgi:hypothetical protein